MTFEFSESDDDDDGGDGDGDDTLSVRRFCMLCPYKLFIYLRALKRQVARKSNHFPI